MPALPALLLPAAAGGGCTSSVDVAACGGGCVVAGDCDAGAGWERASVRETRSGGCAAAVAHRPEHGRVLYLTVAAPADEPEHSGDGFATTATLRAAAKLEERALRHRPHTDPASVRCADTSGCGRCAPKTNCGVAGEGCTDFCTEMEYVPSADTAAGRRAAAGTAVPDAAASAVQRELWALQHPATCSVAAVRRWEAFNQGMGYLLTVASARVTSLHAAAAAGRGGGALFAYDAGPGVHRRTTSTAQGWGPRCATPRYGDTGGLACHLRPATWCDVRLVSPRGEVVHLTKQLGLHPVKGTTRVRPGAPWFGFVPPPLQHRGALWYHAQAHHFLWRPHGAARTAVGRAERALGRREGRHGGWRTVPANPIPGDGEDLTPVTVSPPCIGVHMRRGDACRSAGRRCLPLSRFSDAVERMRAAYGVTRVYVATDEARGQVEKWRDKMRRKRLDVRLVDWDRSVFTTDKSIDHGGSKHQWINHKLMRGEVNGSALAVQWVADMEMLARCSFFVGTFTSTASHWAYTLMAGRLGYIPPYVSVDKKAWASTAKAGAISHMW